MLRSTSNLPTLQIGANHAWKIWRPLTEKATMKLYLRRAAPHHSWSAQKRGGEKEVGSVLIFKFSSCAKDGLKSLCKTQIILLLLTASFHPKYPSTFPHMQRHWNEHEFLRSHSLGATVETLRKRSRVYQKKLNVINTKKSRRGGFFWTQCVLLLESDHVNLRLIWIYELCVSLDRSGFLSSMHLFTLTIWQVAFGFFAPPIGRNITCDTLAPTS